MGSYIAYDGAPLLRTFYTRLYLAGIPRTFIKSRTADYNFKDMIILRGDTPYVIQYDGANYYIDASVFNLLDLDTDVIVVLFSYN